MQCAAVKTAVSPITVLVHRPPPLRKENVAGQSLFAAGTPPSTCGAPSGASGSTISKLDWAKLMFAEKMTERPKAASAEKRILNSDQR
jgi:hypothetical protein